MIDELIKYLEIDISENSQSVDYEYLYIDRQPAIFGSNLLLIFYKKNKIPFKIAKFSKIPKYNFIIEDEYKALQILNRCLSTSLKQNIPSNPRLFRHKNLFILIINYFPGETLTEFLISKNYKLESKVEIIENCLGWLKDFQGQTTRKEVTASELITEEYMKLLEYFESRYAKLNSIKYKNAKKIFFSYMYQNNKIVCSHGDFWGGNILINSRKEFLIIDWAHFTKNSLYFWDIISFFSTLKQQVIRNKSLLYTCIELEKKYYNNYNLDRDLINTFQIIYAAMKSVWSEFYFDSKNYYDKQWIYYLQ